MDYFDSRKIVSRKLDMDMQPIINIEEGNYDISSDDIVLDDDGEAPMQETNEDNETIQIANDIMSSMLHEDVGSDEVEYGVDICMEKNVQNMQKDDTYVEPKIDGDRMIEIVPNLPEEHTPIVGMQFDTEIAAYEFYNTYARIGGFDTRKSVRKTKRGEACYRLFLCTKEGKKKSSEDVKRSYVSIKCDCRAKMSVSKCQKIGKWVVRNIYYGHNHVLHTPSKINMYHSNRKLDPSQKKVLDGMLASGMRPSQAMRLLSYEAGGRQNLPFDVQQIYAEKRKYTKSYTGIDSQMMLNYFLKKKEENPSFYFAIQIEENHEIGNIFWVDARAREDYHYFGDIVSFDTTYKVNKYLMPFAPFTGVNHHRQSIVFGCALLVNEKKESFVWVFKEWLSAMGNQHPATVITDQDLAMRAAIEDVFPNSVHRFCRWHIMQKVPKNLKSLYKRNSNFKALWDKWFYCSDSIEKFESSWNVLTTNFPSLLNARFATGLWEDRTKWCKLYPPYTFTAGIFTTQRSESMNSLFKKKVDQNTPLHVFVSKFEFAMAERRLAEKESNKNMIDKCIPCLAEIPMEQHLREVFTPVIFKEVRLEYIKSLSCFLHIEVDGDIKSYSGRQRLTNGNLQEFKMTYDRFTQEISGCSCKLWEYSGIPCCHMFSVMQLEEIHELPKKYILKRWTKEAKVSSRSIFHTKDASSHNSFMMKSHLFHLKLNKLGSEAKKSEKTLDDALLWIDQWMKQVEQSNMMVDENQEALCIEKTDSMQQLQNENVFRSSDSNVKGIVIKDRLPVHAKGSSKRLLSAFEQGIKAKVCHSCGNRGDDSRTCELSITSSNTGEVVTKIARKCHHCYATGHDKRNCPQMKKLSPPSSSPAI